MFNTMHTQFFKFAICITALVLIPLQVDAKTFETEHFKFSAGPMWLYSEEEKQTIDQCVARLEDVWQHVNRICDNQLPKKIRIGVIRERTRSRALREKDKVQINSLKIKNGLRDCLTIMAHETAHLCYYQLSNGKISSEIHEFLDEGISSYAMYSFEPREDDKRKFSLNVAKDDLESGAASLAYLRNWQENVNDRLGPFSREWRRKNPNKYTSIEDELKVGVNSYFTSTVFVEYIIDIYGLSKFNSAVKNIGNGHKQSEAFKKATGKSIEELFIDWHEFLRGWEPVPIKWDPQKVQTY